MYPVWWLRWNSLLFMDSHRGRIHHHRSYFEPMTILFSQITVMRFCNCKSSQIYLIPNVLSLLSHCLRQYRLTRCGLAVSYMASCSWFNIGPGKRGMSLKQNFWEFWWICNWILLIFFILINQQIVYVTTGLSSYALISSWRLQMFWH